MTKLETFALVCFFALALIVGGVFVGKALNPPQVNVQPNLGSTIGYQSSQGSQLTFNAFNSILTDLQALRSTTAGIQSTVTASILEPALATSTLAQTTTTVLSVPASLGDAVFVFPNIVVSGSYFSGYVSTASTTGATITIVQQLSAYAAAASASTTFNVLILPHSSFTAPAALVTATSATQY